MNSYERRLDLKNPCEGCIIQPVCEVACEKFKKYYNDVHPCNDCELRGSCADDLGVLDCAEFWNFEHEHNKDWSAS